MEAALGMKGTGKGRRKEERLLQLEAGLNTPQHVKGKSKGAPKEVRMMWLESAFKDRARTGKGKGR